MTDESSIEFAKPDYINGRFGNPKSFTDWKGLPSPLDVFKWKALEHNLSLIPTEEVLEKNLPVISPEYDLKSELSATWLGHATVFVHLEGINFITDPVFATRASPSRFFGPRRYRKPPSKFNELPEINIGVISHNHYDHLDAEAVKQISLLNSKMTWFVPLGLKTFMDSIVGGAKVIEKNWGETETIEFNGKQFTILCTPAQHWSQRGVFDRFKTLWSGWALLGSQHKFFYTGDTGFCDEEYKKLGKKYGPFQLAAIPIGCYCPRWFMQSQHINPEEAVAIHKHVKAEYTMGIHFGTYEMGSNEPYLEPRELFLKAGENLPEGEIFTLGHGVTWKYQQK
uniref:Metallo-beta-lactamase domain-containing protein n=1 Tax=Panagrolaimus superbus TaxID=310955 RepID=A0A914YU81_9BILA